jgi:hypothetical protein
VSLKARLIGQARLEAAEEAAEQLRQQLAGTGAESEQHAAVAAARAAAEARCEALAASNADLEMRLNDQSGALSEVVEARTRTPPPEPLSTALPSSYGIAVPRGRPIQPVCWASLPCRKAQERTSAFAGATPQGAHACPVPGHGWDALQLD